MDVEWLWRTSSVMRRVHAFVDGKEVVSIGSVVRPGVLVVCKHGVSNDSSKVFVEGRDGQCFWPVDGIVVQHNIDAAFLLCKLEDGQQCLHDFSECGDVGSVGSQLAVLSMDTSARARVSVGCLHSILDSSFTYTSCHDMREGSSGSLIFLNEKWVGMHLGEKKSEHGYYRGLLSRFINVECIEEIKHDDAAACMSFDDVLVRMPTAVPPLDKNGLLGWLSVQNEKSKYINPAKLRSVGVSV